jgi:hypothetical protein
MNDRFEELLTELGSVFGLKLKADKHHFCTLQVKEGVQVQLQSDASFEQLLIISRVAELPAGKFREQVLEASLKANGRPDPRAGVFAYLAPQNQLVFFQRYPFDILNGERLAALLGAFLDEVEAWKKAITSGQPCPPTMAS